MRWLRFSRQGRIAYGMLDGDRVVEVRGTPWAWHEPTGEDFDLSEVTLEIPVVPGTFYCAGANYTKHVLAVAAQQGREPNLPPSPHIGYRANSALVAHNVPVIIPADATDKIHYEGELAVVIGKTARNLSKADAMSCVFGYTIGNDVSERTWQKADRTMWRAKNADTFKPMGPWIETDVDLDAMETIVRVNGEVHTQFDTKDMLFDIPTFISDISAYMTLLPGDVIWMGTDGESPDLKDGDEVAIEITGIGTLVNRFEKQKA
jgi:2-keto-4-pentenoate hydratase/2-oxohepta-3-ene-1,7-dioic acid hydratase in catechol pathway